MDTFLQQLAATSPVEWIGMLTGVIGVVFSIKEKIWAWPLFIICYSCYIYISYVFGLNALMGMNVVFVGLSIYGWIKWSRAGNSEDNLPLSRTNPAQWPLIALFIGVSTLGLGWLLNQASHANLPFWDAFATSCGFTAQWMLGRKKIETWLFWIVSDIIYLVIFAMGAYWPTVMLFGLFIILATKGWRDWSKTCPLQTAPSP